MFTELITEVVPSKYIEIKIVKEMQRNAGKGKADEST